MIPSENLYGGRIYRPKMHYVGRMPAHQGVLSRGFIKQLAVRDIMGNKSSLSKTDFLLCNALQQGANPLQRCCNSYVILSSDFEWLLVFTNQLEGLIHITYPVQVGLDRADVTA